MAASDKPEILSPTSDVYCWVEADSSIMLKAATKFNDPVELSADEAKDIAQALLKLADQLEHPA